MLPKTAKVFGDFPVQQKEFVLAEEVKEGDVVRLKSGGRTMTVGKVGNYNAGRLAKCAWFDGAGNFQEADIHVVSLVAVDPAANDGNA